MIGQTKLLNKFKSYTLRTLPHSIMLIGEEGSGKHTLVNEIAKYYNLETIIIDEKTTPEQLAEYQYSPIAKVYVLSLDTMLEKQQNQFLKFIEEPSKTVYIFVLTTSEIGVLPTILNRCQIYHLEEYTIDQLKQINSNIDELAYTICKTPGQLLLLDNNILKTLYNTCKIFLVDLIRANYAKILGYSTKINYKEDYKKFDFNLFFKILEYVAFEDYLKNNNEKSYNIYLFTENYLQRLLYKNIAKDNFMINYLIALKNEIKGLN